MWFTKKFKVGDRVVIRDYEEGANTGTIVSKWDRGDGQYDWWVQITFHFQGDIVNSKVPVKESEIRKK